MAVERRTTALSIFIFVIGFLRIRYEENRLSEETFRQSSERVLRCTPCEARPWEPPHRTGLACALSPRLCQHRSANPVIWLLAPGRPERRRDAAYPRPVPPDAPAVKPSRTGSETWPLKAAPVGIGPWLPFQTPTASRLPWATVLSEHRAGDGGGKNNESAKCLHWLPPRSGPEEAPCHENVPAFNRTCWERGPRAPPVHWCVPGVPGGGLLLGWRISGLLW